MKVKIFGKMMNGLRKIKKRNPVKSNVFLTPPDLVGAIFAFGRINSGKTTSLLSFAQTYHDNPTKRYKIFDLWGGDRNEHLFWTLPSNKLKYWNDVKKTLRLDSPGPKQYKVNLLYPLSSKLPKRLPSNPPYVKSKIITIPFRNVELEDIRLIVGNLSKRDEDIWSEILYNSKTKTSIPEMLDLVKKLKAEKHTLYKNFIKPLSRNLLLQDDNCNFNFNIKEELDDRDTISVLCLEHLEKEYRLFVIGYILKEMANELDRKYRKVIGIIREASEFFRVTDQTIVPERVKIFKAYLSQWIRMGRRGMHLLLDSQSPNETHGILDGQQDLTLLGRLPSENDRVAATNQLSRDNLITRKQIDSIGKLEPGQFVVCPSGRHAESYYFLLPRTRFWEEGCGNFYKSVWKNAVDKWCNYNIEIEELKESFKRKSPKIEVEIKPKPIKKKVEVKVLKEIKKKEIPREVCISASDGFL